jgi:hypothetical protein
MIDVLTLIFDENFGQSKNRSCLLVPVPVCVPVPDFSL